MKGLLIFGSSFRLSERTVYLVSFNQGAEDPQWYFVEWSAANEVPHGLPARTKIAYFPVIICLLPLYYSCICHCNTLPHPNFSATFCAR